jgi:hypothetical protein
VSNGASGKDSLRDAVMAHARRPVAHRASSPETSARRKLVRVGDPRIVARSGGA